MKDYKKNMLLALGCFLVIVVLNFFLPRLLPGDPVAYLTGFAEEDMTPAQIDYYRQALHLDKPLIVQFGYYLRSLADGTLGYSYKKSAAVALLIRERLGYTLQITVPAVLLSAALGLSWGLVCGYRKNSMGDRLSTGSLIVLNAVPTFVIGLVLMLVFCFQSRLLPYAGLSSSGIVKGSPGYTLDRLRHLALPVLTLTLAALPNRYLLVRNMAAQETDEKYILYAKQRGLSGRTIRWSYLLRNIAQPFVNMLGMSVSVCVGGSVVIERIFSIGGMGSLLTEAVYTLDYPLMQGILFVTTCIMVLSILLCDLICVLIDPKRRREGAKCRKRAFSRCASALRCWRSFCWPPSPPASSRPTARRSCSRDGFPPEARICSAPTRWATTSSRSWSTARVKHFWQAF